MKSFATLAALLLPTAAVGHFGYPAGSLLPAEEDCRSFSADNVPIISHHIHLFRDSGSGANQIEQPIGPASKILAKMYEAFNITQECDSWIGHDARRCGFNVDGSFGSDGPGWYFLPSLPEKNWAVSILPSDFGAAVQWISQNRCADNNGTVVCYDVLVHPNTGCMVNDHNEWGAWFGTPHRVVEVGFAPCLYGCGPTTQLGCNGFPGKCDAVERGGCCGDDWVRSKETAIFNGGYPDKDCAVTGNALCKGHPDTWAAIMDKARVKPDEYAIELL